MLTGASELNFENPNMPTCSPIASFSCGWRPARGRRHRRIVRAAGGWQAGRRSPRCRSAISIDFSCIDLSADGKTLYLIDSRGRDKAALFAARYGDARDETARRRRRGRYRRRSRSTKSRRPVAALAIRDRARWHRRRPERAAGSRGSRPPWFRATSFSQRQCRPPGGQLYMNATARAANLRCSTARRARCGKLFVQRKALAGVPLRKMQPVIIPARDGLRSTAI